MLITVPIEVYREFAGDVLGMTSRWPLAVWEAITQVLDKADICPAGGVELYAIVDEYAWSLEMVPFTLGYISPDRFRDVVYREASRYGAGSVDLRSSLDRQLASVAAANLAGIRNKGRQAREEVDIAIEEYLIARAAGSRVVLGAGETPDCSGASDPSPSYDKVYEPPCEIFLAMERLTATELSIVFVGDKAEDGIGANNMLNISARGESERVSLAELDLINRTTGALNNQGAILLGLTRVKAIPGTDANRKKVSRLRAIFRDRLGVKDDPFEAPVPGIGWRPRFKIVDRRGDADERAKRSAEKRTISLDQHPQVLGGNDVADEIEKAQDDADAWLRENDPDGQA